MSLHAMTDSSKAADVLPSCEYCDRILNAIQQADGLPRQDQVHQFATDFLKRAIREDLVQYTPKTWVLLLADLLDAIRIRGSKQGVVRVFNPDAERDGYDSPRTVIQIATDDMPFLVDSFTMAIGQLDLNLHTLIHPVMHVKRDAGGHVMGFSDEKAPLESVMHLEVDRQSKPADLERIQIAIEKALTDVRVCVEDWPSMRQAMLDAINEWDDRPMPVDDEARAETKAFLSWVADNHFTFLGCREYVADRTVEPALLRTVTESGLGLMRVSEDDVLERPLDTLSYDEEKGDIFGAIIVTKTNARSTVHRKGYMDYIGVLYFDENGQRVAEKRFIGLFTSAAYHHRPWEIPLVRKRFEMVMKASGLSENGHSAKALSHILEAMPRDELFQASFDELAQTAIGILNLQERSRTRLFLRRDRYGRFFSVLAFIPRDRFNTQVRKRIEAMLRTELKAERLDTSSRLGESNLAQLHIVVRPKKRAKKSVDVAAIENKLIEIVRNWHDDLTDALVIRHGESKGLSMAKRFGQALPAGYIESVTPEVAARDVAHAANIKVPEDIVLDVARHADQPADEFRVKVFRYGKPMALSDVLPMMEDMGLRVVSEHPYEMTLPDGSIYIQDFTVESRNGQEVHLEQIEKDFKQAFVRIWKGDVESDRFNALITRAAMDWRQVAVLRAYIKYLLQTGLPFSQRYMEDAIVNHPFTVALLVALFDAHFNPNWTGEGGTSLEALSDQLHAINIQWSQEELDDFMARRFDEETWSNRNKAVASLKEGIDEVLDYVRSLDEDRILRSLVQAIEATLRTSFYQEDVMRGQAPISLKFDPSQMSFLPKPRPYREIFVCGPRVEGTHLRFGPVARGGLRWSDRREDFRTEVLGLVKAQMVKNTVIIPEGAKGGFFVKKPPVNGDRDAQLAEGVACYRQFINGLLSITDNLVDDAVVPPDDVVRRDGDDAYLVVAADKGTAKFSDIANAISIDRRFWMGDAFASGGSVGYDHKAMGITAKGAWVSVQRHFRALGIDCQNEDFTCVGIGDMSGDVFGNGMLLSKHIRLIAAFDHRHIFIDPNPDAAKSFKERQRLFDLPRSTWESYNPKLISAGGGVYPRSAKSIELSDEAKKALGIASNIKSVTPNQLMSHVLKATVDLLWNGGIGTYIKASTETHDDVGDRANNALRVNGNEVRCRVIGEGGNLGMTQLGRIEAGQKGVLLNTDFIDNSAGVDTSDHEVNIKILLDAAVKNGKMDMEARNKLLADMEHEVGELVLIDNYRQNQAITVMESMSAPRLGAKQHFIRKLEADGMLDRELEYLPSDKELAQRKSKGQGLTRPELSVILSYAKISIFQDMLNSDVPEDPYLSQELQRYFPKVLQEQCAEEMQSHRLRREIIATTVTNSIVNRMGATFLLRMIEDTGSTPAQVARAYTAANRILEARALWKDIDALDLKVSDETQIQALYEIWAVLRSMTRWLLSHEPASQGITDMVDRYLPMLRQLRKSAEDAMCDRDRKDLKRSLKGWMNKQVPEKMANELALLPMLVSSLDIIATAQKLDQPVVAVARIYSDLGDTLHLKWLHERIEELPVEGRWHAHARGVMRDELNKQQSGLVEAVMHVVNAKKASDVSLKQWLKDSSPRVRAVTDMLSDMRSQKNIDYATVSVAIRRLAQMRDDALKADSSS